jgi:hypothetical protein
VVLPFRFVQRGILFCFDVLRVIDRPCVVFIELFDGAPESLKSSAGVSGAVWMDEAVGCAFVSKV